MYLLTKGFRVKFPLYGFYSLNIVQVEKVSPKPIVMGYCEENHLKYTECLHILGLYSIKIQHIQTNAPIIIMSPTPNFRVTRNWV